MAVLPPMAAEPSPGRTPTKVDRSAAYMARAIARNVVGAWLAEECQVSISYAIGKAQPTAVEIDTFGTARVDEDVIRLAVLDCIRPASRRHHLRTAPPHAPYADTAAYGHFNGTSSAGRTSTRQMSCERRWKSMLIERKHTADLIPADYNPRKDLKPGDPEYDKLKRSMEQFGYVEPVIWNKSTGRVVGGHQRLKVLMDMGVTEVECVVVEMDEEREKALNIALNKISGDWDKDKLMLPYLRPAGRRL